MDSKPASGLWNTPGHEALLVHSAQHGDLPALLELVRHHQRPLWRLCFAFTRDVVEAERLLQETARRARRNLRQLQPDQSFFPWIARLARTLAVAQARRRAGETRELPARRPNGMDWVEGARGAHDVSYEQRVLERYADLSQDDQMLLALRLFERMPYAQVAAVSGLSLAATMHRIAVARETLEHAIEGEERAA